MVINRTIALMDAQTILTFVVSLGWVASFVVRLGRPDWPPGPAVDAIMLVVVSYWFAVRAMRKPPGDNNGNGGEK